MKFHQTDFQMLAVSKFRWIFRKRMIFSHEKGIQAVHSTALSCASLWHSTAQESISSHIARHVLNELPINPEITKSVKDVIASGTTVTPV
jgi:hypothetical protein